MNTPARGFIALMSAVIISAVLLLLVSGSSLAGFSARTNAARYESKRESAGLADGCLSRAILSVGGDPRYRGGETIALGRGTCSIETLMEDRTGIRVRTTGIVRGARTTLEAVIRPSDLSIRSYTEIP